MNFLDPLYIATIQAMECHKAKAEELAVKRSYGQRMDSVRSFIKAEDAIFYPIIDRTLELLTKFDYQQRAMLGAK